jgi:hypothetical protein
MRNATALFLIAWLTSASWAQEAESAPSPAEIAKLVQQLDAEKFAEREAARDALVKIGAPARRAVEAALKDEKSSAEVKLRAAEIAKQLDLEQVRAEAVSIAAIVEQARLANRGKLDPAKLEVLLEKVAKVWTDVSGAPHPLPVNIKDLARGEAADRISAHNSLVTLKSGHYSSVRKSIILAETAVDVSSARDCIIIAGISASVSSPHNCIVISGYDLDASSGEENLLLCGGEMRGSIVKKSVIGAPLGWNVSIGENLTYLNSPEPKAVFADDRNPERVPKRAKSEAIVLDMPEQKNDLAELITVTLALGTRGTEPIVLFRRKEGDGEYVARGGQELKFPDGKPMPELAGWKLIYCSSRRGAYAVFEKDDRQVMLRAR